jgi:RNase P/RNase MRP subunit p29
MNKVRQKEERRGLDGRIVTQTKNFLRNLEVNSKYFIRNKIMLYRLSRLDVFKKTLIADYYWSPSMELRAH